MVDLIILDEDDRIDPLPNHIKYISQDIREFERLVQNYKSDALSDILCYALNEDNIDMIINLAESFVKSTKNQDILSSSDLVILVSSTRDENIILKILTKFRCSDDIANDIAYAIGHDSNIVLLYILIDKYKFKINNESLNEIITYCNAETFLTAIHNTDEYIPSKIINSLVSSSILSPTKYTINDVEIILDTILAKYPHNNLSKSEIGIETETESDFDFDFDFDLFCFDNITDIAMIDMLITKLKLTSCQLINIIKYKKSDTCFYHICRTYLKNQSVCVKMKIAQIYKYKCDDMLKNELHKLLFLIEEMNVPLEFYVLQEFGKEFNPYKWSSTLFDINYNNYKNNDVTFEQIEKLIRLCTDKSIESVKLKYVVL